jgi:hypothetical protein
VEFASIADLERIVGVIAPQLIEHGLTQLERPNRP